MLTVSIPRSIYGRSTRAVGHFLTLAAFAASAGAGLGEPARTDLEIHTECAASAERHVLDPGAARLCADAYQRIKLSFLLGIGPDQYHALPPVLRARTNKAGYSAFLKWKLNYAGFFGEPATPANGKKIGSGW